MATSKKPAQVDTQDEVIVNQLGDVTESNEPSGAAGPSIEMRPLSELPKSHAGVAKTYPTAKGFTQEGDSIALHF